MTEPTKHPQKAEKPCPPAEASRDEPPPSAAGSPLAPGMRGLSITGDATRSDGRIVREIDDLPADQPSGTTGLPVNGG
jgi:hypothetical protein